MIATTIVVHCKEEEEIKRHIIVCPALSYATSWGFRPDGSGALGYGNRSSRDDGVSAHCTCPVWHQQLVAHGMWERNLARVTVMKRCWLNLMLNGCARICIFNGGGLRPPPPTPFFVGAPPPHPLLGGCAPKPRFHVVNQTSINLMYQQ